MRDTLNQLQIIYNNNFAFCRRKEGNVLFNDTLNTRTTEIARDETRCHHIGYAFWLAAKVLLYASYHDLCYTSRGALAGMRNTGIL